MNKSIKFFLCGIALIISGFACTPQEKSIINTGGPEVVSFRALPFSLTEVKLLDGPFLHAAELDAKILLSYEPDRFLSKFYSEAGLTPKAEHYMGWENETLAGHSLGHYLSACSMMFQTTGDNRFLERVNYIVDELKKLQDADGDGYIGAFPDGKKIFEEEVAKGDIRSQGFDLNGIWAPFYTQHKIMAGLRDAYHLNGNQTALEVEKRFADWVDGIVSPLNNEQVQKMLRCEHGGISETLADLYADTKDEKYLRISRIFYQKAILDPLKNGEDVLPGKHCNTNIPKLIALSRLYELTGDTSDRKAAEFFWQTVVNHHSYVTGGNGNDEYFGPADKLRDRLGEGTTESCNVYNMLKLTEHLFEWDASAKTADFYERALFNHILSTQNPEDGHVTYNLSLDMGGYKDFQDPLWFTCCIGTGMENHSKYGRNIFYYNDDELFLFQFIASELTWKEKGITVTQNTGYPEEQGTTLDFRCEKPVELTLRIRYPYWAEKGVEVMVNGSKKRIRQEPGSFIAINRKWKTGDKVEVKIPFSLRLESMPDDSNRVAVMYGPLVMAVDLGPVQDSASQDIMYVPVMMTEERDPAVWMKPVEGKINTFMTVNTGRPRDVEMTPFYSVYGRRYSIYWDLFDEAGWNARQAEHKAELERMKKISDATIDFVQPGEIQPERDHNFKGEKTSPGRFKERPNRESRSGWFSYDLKITTNTPVALVVEYWGGFPGAKTFDILVNDKIIATENISNKKDGQFISIQYDIPEEVTKGSSKITVKFQAHPGNMAGPVFGIRTIRN
ncbi:MAG: glycoside hydrolase family 127 protein [Bacteroidales bacterium]|nr:glycoside hydrolase family 127 protein [Bacteroidales bacterium]